MYFTFNGQFRQLLQKVRQYVAESDLQTRIEQPETPKLRRIYRKVACLMILVPILTGTPSYADTLPDFSALVEKEGDAVVKISVVASVPTASQGGIPGIDPDMIPEQFRRFFEQLPNSPEQAPREGAGFGSGFVISDEGYIITNAHVVSNATEIRVGLNDRREYVAELVGSDPASDIALLKIDAEDLTTVIIGDSDDLRVGEWVLAIGSPFGFEHTATQGIVSALARSLPDDTYVPFIQTDVAVNPGNSGGPLFNTDGEVVGVNSQIYSRSGGYQGLSFSIPINVAMSIADQLKDQGYATRGWLGVAIQNVDQALAKSFGLTKPEGALVAQVTSNSPADKAGLESGDIILEFNDKPVSYSSELPPYVGAVPPGDTASMLVLRDGKRTTMDVVIEPLDEGERVAAIPSKRASDESRMGAKLAALPGEQKEEMGIDYGVLIADVDPQGAAAEAGIRPGDVLLSFNRVQIDSMDELDEIVSTAPADEAIPVLVQRDSAPMFLALTLPAARG